MTNNISRRSFIRNTSLAAGAVALSASKEHIFYDPAGRNKLPRWKGFNLLDFFSANAPRDPGSPSFTTNDDLKWMADWGFDFVRIPMAYPRYISFDRSNNVTPDDIYRFDEKVLDKIDDLVYRATKQGLHVSLNLHRAPGYCINAGFHEPFNLWKDKEALDAFVYHWGMWAERYSSIPSELLSFDLLNEPAFIEDMNDQYAAKKPVPGETYRHVAEHAAGVIREISPDRLIIADGNSGGSNVTPELFDLNLGQSCRGYFPHYVSHFQASWVWKDPSKAPVPVWPGIIDGKQFSRKNLEDFYKPWIDALDKGIGVHCGECGCYNKTPHKVFLPGSKM